MLRAMKAGQDGLPIVERSARGLGVRVPQDVQLDGEDVIPGKGMSVTIGAIADLPPHRIPAAHGGDSKDPVYEMTEFLPATLALFQTPPTPSHWEVGPRERSRLEDFELVLASTRPAWRRIA
jgi:hypothetical protein